jgi:SAM-dependent methyltransferase
MPAVVAWLCFSPRSDGGGYHDFWHGVGTEFPDLGGAPSTALYRDSEIRLLSTAIHDWRGLRVLKTDLWDEARNTRILQWAAGQGAEVFGIDISEPTLRQARAQFSAAPLRAGVADVREIPFADASFDVIYSMGTIEHFDGSEDAVVEMARVLKPGGRLILGVPNRFDPFLRPVMVWALWALGHYGYGFEKSYSRRALRRMLQRADLEVVDESGILFIPGWLRMADLFAHTRAPWLRALTARMVRIFVSIDRRVSSARRHGYLLASSATRKSD